MNKSTKKPKEEYISTDGKPNSVSEPLTEYAKKEDDMAVIPKGYMTSNEFWELQMKKTKAFCEENGIL